MAVRIDSSLEGIDWEQAKADLAADRWDNGRSAAALRRSFEQSQHVAFARDGQRVIGMARLLSDGVCNAYLVDVWTHSSYRRQGVASDMIRQLLAEVPGQHVGLQ
ncbi:MAG TPA: GNAT family N-acetyltransferase, partial [Gaiellaceae bacterium]|nr:GNAT family N-acetyltransferase [Gaiellaceae bacterium]